MVKNKSPLHECKICGLIVKNSWGLSEHIRRKHTNEKPFLCDFCPKAFPKKYELKRHYLIHTGEKPYKCSLCSASYRSRNSRNAHEESHGILRYKCKFCDLHFFHREEKCIHQKKAHHSISDSKFQCNECLKTFVNEKFLTLHKKEHNVISIQCPACQLAFSTKREFKIHERSHLGLKKNRGRGKRSWTPFFCHICNETFISKYDIMKHFSKFHPAEITSAFHQKCKYCEKVFSSKINLNTHLVSHSNERKFPCTKCSYKAKRQRDLDIHEVGVHRRKGLHQCHYCEKSFPVISMYRSHINKHENNRSFKCKFCQKAYFCQKQLNDHLKKHNDNSNEKTEKELCPLCGKLLAATYMPNHLKYHESEECEDKEIEKPNVTGSYKKVTFQGNLQNNKNLIQGTKQGYKYKCKKCGSRFEIKSEQYPHKEACVKKICIYCKKIDSEHSVKLYQCLTCSKKYHSNSYLISHAVTQTDKCFDNYSNERTVAGGYYFECFSCGILCRSEHSLNLHIMIHKNLKSGYSMFD